MRQRVLTPLDRLLAGANNALRTVSAPAGRPARENPASDVGEAALDDRQRLHAADLIISKGQGNFETLNDTDRDVFFLLRPKCPVLARHLNAEIGCQILVRSGGELSASR